MHRCQGQRVDAERHAVRARHEAGDQAHRRGEDGPGTGAEAGGGTAICTAGVWRVRHRQRPQHAPRTRTGSAGLPAPPALFQCTTWQRDSYFGETATPEPRCAPLDVVGIDGSRALGMGQACEMKEDSCVEVPADQLCDTWYRKLDQAEFKLRYAGNDNRAERQREFDDVDAKIKASNCSLEAPAADPAATP